MSDTVFVDKKNTYVLSFGKEIVIPKMSLRILLTTSSVISDFIKEIKQEHPQILEGFFDNKDGVVNTNFLNTLFTQLPFILPDIFNKLLKNVIKLISSYTNTDEEEILEQWTTDDLIGVLNPFFVHILTQFNQIMEKMPKQTDQQSL